MVLDVVAVRVFGAVQARDVRIVWADGTLYVAKSPTDIITFACEKPVKSSGTYKVTLGEATLRFQLATCGSCRRRIQQSPVGRMSASEVMAAANRVDA